MIKNKLKIISTSILALGLFLGFAGNIHAADLTWSAATSVTLGSDTYSIGINSEADSVIISTNTVYSHFPT